MTAAFSEYDYVVKFWGPLIEKAFKNSSRIPHWGDTVSNPLLSMGIKMKMDLRFITTTYNKETEDHGYGEFAKECSSPKYYKDKLKNVVSSKALYNSIAHKNGLKPEDCLYIPFLIVMGFEIHLCALHKEEELYVYQRIRSMVFPVARGNFAEEAANLKEGLCELVDMCEKIKRESCRGTKRKSMDSRLGF